MSAKDRAKVGDVFWIVVENFYKPEGSHLVDKEYCVVSGTVSKLLTEWDEMVLTGPGSGYSGSGGKPPCTPESLPKRTTGCGPT